MKKTKIVCTIGPSSKKEEVLQELFLNGLNVARLNFSHGTHEEHKETIDIIKKTRERLDLPIGIMLDTKGPEIRIGNFKEEEIEFPLMKEDEKEENFANREKIREIIKELKEEHDAAGELLRQLRKVTNDYELPADACNSYRIAYGKLEELENDIFQHVHLENNILFPRYEE